MARIEISMVEYQSLQSEIKKLQEENQGLQNNLNSVTEKYNTLMELLEEIKETAFFERIFKWKEVVMAITNYLISYKNNE